MCSKFTKGLDPKQKYLIPYRADILFNMTKSKLKVLAADDSKLDGFNASFGLLDEYHAAKNSKVRDVIKSSMGMRENPHLCTITTAGFDKTLPCYQLRSYCIDVLKGVKTDESMYVIIYTLDADDDWTEESVWKKAIPNLGITTKIDTLRDVVNRARQNPSDEVDCKTKQFDLWCDSSSVWIPEYVIRNSLRRVDMSEFIGKNNYLVYIGFDLSSVSDLTALSFLFIDPDKEEYVFKNFYYLPKTALDGKYNSELYKYWSSRGYLIITDSPTTDYNYIKNQILYWYDKLEILGIFYDSWNSTQLCNELINEGLPMKAFSQSIGHFSRGTKEYERLMLSGKVVIDDNPINRFCHDNVELRIDSNGNCKPMGDHEKKKIDGVIAQLTSLGGYLDEIYGGYSSPFVIPLS